MPSLETFKNNRALKTIEKCNAWGLPRHAIHLQLLKIYEASYKLIVEKCNDTQNMR